MRERKTITKKDLVKLRITDVTEDGEIYYKGKPAKTFDAVCKHKYGKDKKYPVINIYDPNKHLEQVKNGNKLAPGNRLLLVSRVAYAWHHGICPGEYDVDHIDNDPYNNNINNLQLLTRQENLARRNTRNKYTVGMSKEDYEYFNSQIYLMKAAIDTLRKQWKEKQSIREMKKAEVKIFTNICKNPAKYEHFNSIKEKKKEELNKLDEDIKLLKATWRRKIKEFYDFRNNFRLNRGEK